MNMKNMSRLLSCVTKFSHEKSIYITKKFYDNYDN